MGLRVLADIQDLCFQEVSHGNGLQGATGGDHLEAADFSVIERTCFDLVQRIFIGQGFQFGNGDAFDAGDAGVFGQDCFELCIDEHGCRAGIEAQQSDVADGVRDEAGGGFGPGASGAVKKVGFCASCCKPRAFEDTIFCQKLANLSFVDDTNIFAISN